LCASAQSLGQSAPNRNAERVRFRLFSPLGKHGFNAMPANLAAPDRGDRAALSEAGFGATRQSILSACCGCTFFNNGTAWPTGRLMTHFTRKANDLSGRMLAARCANGRSILAWSKSRNGSAVAGHGRQPIPAVYRKSGADIRTSEPPQKADLQWPIIAVAISAE